LTEQESLSQTSLPKARLRHIGIIMDGNGRWAKRQGRLRTQGHLEGIVAAKRVVKAASDLGVRYLTLYTFSTENWKRAEEEVGFVLGLAKKHLRAEFEFYKENRIRVRHAGNRENLPPDILSEIDGACADTAGFSGLQVIIALNYGGRDEIVRSVRKLAASGKEITEASISANLDNPDIPDPDLIIRTAGEFRSSNFLLWQSAYAEYHISRKLWPDWEACDLEQAIKDYESRDRRFGAVQEPVGQ